MNTRSTIQRSLVLEAVKNLRCHAATEEIYSHIIRKHPNISKGTVYRNLSLLADLGEIRKVEIPGGADRYDHQCHEHYHVCCVRCGRVSDVEMDIIADLEERIVDTQGFRFLGHDIVFKGVCPECNNTNERNG